MLIRPHDDGTADDSRWREFVNRQGFGQFVAGGRDRDVPVVVPTQFVLDGDRVVFHLAAPNPALAALAENPRCLMSVAGDWAYIPGAWKAIGAEDPARGIPTTYYGAVQLIGTATVHRDPGAIAPILRQQLEAVEPDGGLIDPAEHGATLKGIGAIVVAIDEVRAKFKYGGNVDLAHREYVASKLAERDGPGDAAARAQMGLDATGG